MRELTVVSAALVLALFATQIYGQDGMPPALVKVASVKIQSLAPVTWVSGSVASRYDARLAAEVEGRLVWVADVGTAVVMGDELARIEDTSLRLRNDELEADIERARARLVFLESEEKRFRKLADYFSLQEIRRRVG